MASSGPFKIRLLVGAMLCLVPGEKLLAQDRPEKPVRDRPNIIFILADDQSWNGTSVPMHPDMPNSRSDFYRTPNLEALAGRGMRFSRAYAPGPMCSPTRASLQTGKSPAQLRMTNVGRGRPATASQRLVLPDHSSTLPEGEVTIGEVLKTAGYATAWFGKWHLGRTGPGAHGYDQHDGPTGNADGNQEDDANPKDIFGITHRGIAFMENNVRAGRPFYLQLWHYAVHGPVQSREQTRQTIATRPAGQTHRSTAFAAMTEDLDAGVGMVLQAVERLSISDSTYIIYMSDHGASRNLSSNSPLNRGKGTLWEGGLRVPLIVSGPGVKSGGFCHVPTVGWDLFPTFCELAGVDKPLPRAVEGVSLVSLFGTGGGHIDRPGGHIAFHFPHYGQSPPHSTITVGNMKLIKFYESGTLRLFDLENDIGEGRDLAQERPELAASLASRLSDYLERVDAGIPSLNPDFDPQAVAETGPAGRRRGSRDRGARRAAQITARLKELAALESALTGDDAEKVGRVLADMKAALNSARPRERGSDRRGPRGGPALEQRRTEIRQLEDAFNSTDTTRLTELVAEIRARLEKTLRDQPDRNSGRSRL